MALTVASKSTKPKLKEGFVSWDLLEKMFHSVNVLDYSECWLWDNYVSGEGYGITTRKINDKVHNLLVHRISYYYTFGVLPEDMVVDHSCHNPKTCISGKSCQHRRCYNPYHLRLVTRAENNKMGANPRINVGVCRNKLHAWTEENVYTYPSGKQMCMACQKERNKRRYGTQKGDI